MSPETETHSFALKMQGELRDFILKFQWPEVDKNLVVADVGTRTFVIAPVLNEIFSGPGFIPEIHGIEIDAQRRFTNFHSRADYGYFYANQIPHGHFHPMDFLKWNRPCDVISLLHPFVTVEPLLRWGLPLRKLKPEEIFDHAFDLLVEQGGLLLVSSPNEEEFKLTEKFARESGFELIQKAHWIPELKSIQKQPRLGALYRARLARATSST